MDTATRRKRLEQLVDLAQAYRGWGRKELAQALGRDTTRLVPQSGLPKLDLLMELSRALDWPVEEVARHLHDDAEGTRAGPTIADAAARSARSTQPGRRRGPEEPSFEEAVRAAADAARARRGVEAIDLARTACRRAGDAAERARALTLEAQGWTALGHHGEASRVTRRALDEPGIPPAHRVGLQLALASHHYALWRLLEARSMAHDVLERTGAGTDAKTDAKTDAGPGKIARAAPDRLGDHRGDDDPGDDRRPVDAIAYAIRGHGGRRLLTVETSDRARCAAGALDDLIRARDLALEIAEDANGPGGADEHRGDAHTCLGGIIEAEAALGRCDAADAVDRLRRGIDAACRAAGSNGAATPSDAMLRSGGWWCVFACNVVLRHVAEERTVQEQLGALGERALTIAERLDDWSLRERALAMDAARRRRFTDWTGVEPECTLDRDGIRRITGVMGRFPRFRPTGWRILEAARIVAGTRRDLRAENRTGGRAIS